MILRSLCEINQQWSERSSNQREEEIRLSTAESSTIHREVTSAFDSYKAMIEHFNSCILENKEPLVTKKNTLDTMSIVDEALGKMERID